MAEKFSLRVAANGRVVMPKALRVALGLKDDGDILVASIHDGEVRLKSIGASVAAVQASFKANVKRAQTNDEFLAQRQKEALSERTFDIVEEKWRV
jgi:bifunctional DNA-binding transcriptional regulator/antitoxin component of YhaV-PrlF toxin-antitoxin module